VQTKRCQKRDHALRAGFACGLVWKPRWPEAVSLGIHEYNRGTVWRIWSAKAAGLLDTLPFAKKECPAALQKVSLDDFTARSMPCSRRLPRVGPTKSKVTYKLTHHFAIELERGVVDRRHLPRVSKSFPAFGNEDEGNDDAWSAGTIRWRFAGWSLVREDYAFSSGFSQLFA